MESGPRLDLNLVVATVNGSGSQSANLILTRSLFGMGIPVAPKNVFPSNIEGLPTWFFLRASSAGHLAGRRLADSRRSRDHRIHPGRKYHEGGVAGEGR